MKKTRKFIGVFSIISLLAIVSCSGVDLSNNLVKMITSQLGVSEDQALGGAGTLLMVAKNALGDNFSSIEKLVPDLSSYTDIAKTVGGANDGISSLADAAPVFENLGMDASKVNDFVPVLTDYVTSAGGDAARELLSGALKK